MLNKKFIIISGTIIIILFSLGAFLLFQYANPWIEKKLSEQLDTLKDSPLNLSYKNLKVNILSGNASLDSVSIYKQEGKNHYTLKFDELKINGLGVVSYMLNNQIKLGRIKIKNPDIKYTRILDADSLDQEENQPFNFPDLFIKSFITENGTFSIDNEKADISNPFVTGKFDLSVNKITTDSTRQYEFEYFDMDQLQVDLADIKVMFPDSLYNADIKSAGFDLKSGSIQIDSVNINSRYEKYKLAHVVNHEIDWVSIHNPSLKINGINMNSLITDGAYFIDCITLEGFDALIFRDKRLPFPQKPDTKLLHQLISELKVKVAIDTIKLKKANIEYQEFVKQAVGPGTVTFEELYASFYNFTNVDTIQERIGYTAHMDAQSKVMGKALLKASFSFPLVDNDQLYTVSGSMAGTKLTTFNPMLEDVAFVRIEKGRMEGLDFEFKYNLNESNGTMNFIYEDLKINTLDKESNHSKGLGENIKSFIANTFVVKTNNLKTDSFRVGKIQFKRNEKKSIFNYWWKSLLTGFRSSTGIKAPKETIDLN